MVRKVEKTSIESEKLIKALTELHKWHEESDLSPPEAASVMGILIARFDEFESGGYSIKSLLTSLAFTIIQDYNQTKEKKNNG